jgi:hypothetical protein
MAPKFQNHIRKRVAVLGESEEEFEIEFNSHYANYPAITHQGQTYLFDHIDWHDRLKYVLAEHVVIGARKPRQKKPVTPPLPKEIWVMAWHTSNMLGSISHVSNGDQFFATEEECQNFIDNMKGWIGMGDRDRYRPMKLVSKSGE